MADHESDTTLRQEWAALDAQPRYVQCPLVNDIDTAQNALEHLLKHGLVDGVVAGMQARVLDIRRVVLADTQRTHSCLKCTTGSEAATDENGTPDKGDKAPDPNACLLPTGRIADWALTSGEMYGVLPGNATGFNRPAGSDDKI